MFEPDHSAVPPGLISVIIPAQNERAYIGACLGALLAQDDGAGPLEVLVAANGCTDDTADVARAEAPGFARRGWRLEVLERPRGGKTGALNAADDTARGGDRVYLDADVLCAPDLMGQLRRALAPRRPLYATGRLRIAPARSWITRRYAELWQRLPFLRPGTAPGAGLFAVNAPGRARWGAFPDIISDDTYARLHFRPEERIEVPATYLWPLPEGFGALVRVRRRQDDGVAEIRHRFPALGANEGKPPLGKRELARLALARPVSLAVYAAVLQASRLRPPDRGWSRGR